MTTEAIRSLPTATLRQIINGIAGLANREFNEPIVRHIAAHELSRRGL